MLYTTLCYCETQFPFSWPLRKTLWAHVMLSFSKWSEGKIWWTFDLRLQFRERELPRTKVSYRIFKTSLSLLNHFTRSVFTKTFGHVPRFGGWETRVRHNVIFWVEDQREAYICWILKDVFACGLCVSFQVDSPTCFAWRWVLNFERLFHNSKLSHFGITTFITQGPFELKILGDFCNIFG